MSFFGNLFGGSDGGPEKNCNCNENLKDHLRKCAGYGERPPLKNCCDIKCADPCKSLDLSGPPTCTGCTPAPKCCPIPPVPLKIFVPKCNVPPTATFKCPESCCETPKKKCCKPPPEPTKCCNEKPKLCPAVVSPDAKEKKQECPKPPPPSSCGCNKGRSGGPSSWCSSDDNNCEPKPLKM